MQFKTLQRLCVTSLISSWHPLRRRQALQPLLSLTHIFICCQDWKRKRRNKGFSWSPLWALSLILGRFVFYVQSTHIHSHGWLLPSPHFCKWSSISERGEVPQNKNKDDWPRLYENGFTNPHEMPWKRMQYVICFWKTWRNGEWWFILGYF